MDTLTCLRSRDGTATKTHKKVWGRWRTESYKAGWRFDAIESPPMSGIDDLSDVLTKIEDRPDWLVIRGALKNGEARQDGVLRRMHDRDGEPAPFAPCDRMWVCLDIDSAPGPWPDHFEPRGADDLKRLVEWSCETYLPEAFQGVDVHYQWSSSAGVGDWSTLSLHLWMWLDRPACDASLRAYFKEKPHIDARLFNPVQIHYTAHPIFEGADDPIAGWRSGLLSLGRGEVVLPDEITNSAGWARLEAEKDRRRQSERRKARSHIRGKAPIKVEDKRAKYAQTALDSACDNILSSPKGQRHDTLFSEAAAIAELVAGGYLDESPAKTALEQAGRATYSDAKRAKDVPRIIEDGFERGTKSPRDLSHIGGTRVVAAPTKSAARQSPRPSTPATPTPDIEPFDCFREEIAEWPPMVRKRWRRRAAELLEQSKGEPHPATFAQMMATSELRADGGTLPPYMLDDDERYDTDCAHCAGQ